MRTHFGLPNFRQGMENKGEKIICVEFSMTAIQSLLQLIALVFPSLTLDSLDARMVSANIDF